MGPNCTVDVAIIAVADAGGNTNTIETVQGMPCTVKERAMNKKVIKTIVLMALFFVAIILFSITTNKDNRDIQTPLGVAKVNVPTDKLVLGTIFRAGLPFHQGFLNIFDHAGNAFVSAFREYEDEAHTKVGIHVEYLATPDLNDATLLIVDPMLATGGSMELGYKALLTKGTPKKVHVVCVMAAPEGIEHIRKTFPDDTTIWCAAVDEGLNEHKYIVPGFGDAGDQSMSQRMFCQDDSWQTR